MKALVALLVFVAPFYAEAVGPAQRMETPRLGVPSDADVVSAEQRAATLPEEEAPEPSSGPERESKKYFAVGEIGFPVFPVPSVGLQAGVFLGPRDALQLEATTGRIGWLFFNIKTTTAGLHYKHFFGNSFYGKLGGDYRKVVIGDPDVPVVGSEIGEVGTAESITASFALGNEWQGDRFTFGIDWIGLMVPVTILHGDLDTSGITGTAKSDLDKVWDGLAKTWSLQLARFYLGVSF